MRPTLVQLLYYRKLVDCHRIYIDSLRVRQIGRQKEIQVFRKRYGYIEKDIGIQKKIQVYRKRYSYIKKIQVYRKRDGKIDKQIDIEIGRSIYIQRDRQKDRQKDREIGRQIADQKDIDSQVYIYRVRKYLKLNQHGIKSFSDALSYYLL